MTSALEHSNMQLIIKKYIHHISHDICVKGEVSPINNVDWVSRKQF